jgi:hypothetical protein
MNSLKSLEPRFVSQLYMSNDSHWQNGLAKSSINFLMTLARALLTVCRLLNLWKIMVLCSIKFIKVKDHHIPKAN